MDEAIRRAVRRAEAEEPGRMERLRALGAEREARASSNENLRRQLGQREQEAVEAQRQLGRAQQSGDPDAIRRAKAENRAALEARNGALQAVRENDARRQAINQEARELSERNDRVYEAAYDPDTGRMVVHNSGAPVPRGGHPGIVLGPRNPNGSLTPGMCGMTHAVGAIQEGRHPDQRGRPIYTSNGGYSFHTDAPSDNHPLPYSHRTACEHCRDVYQLNPHVGAVGEHPREVQNNPEAHPAGSSHPLGSSNESTPLHDL
jgi:hypothetical protein